MCKHPWVRIPLSPPNLHRRTSLFCVMEKYPSGRRGSPAKGVGRETGARVQIPPSPPKNGHPYGCPFFNVVGYERIWTKGSERAICRLLRPFIRGVHIFCLLFKSVLPCGGLLPLGGAKLNVTFHKGGKQHFLCAHVWRFGNFF